MIRLTCYRIIIKKASIVLIRINNIIVITCWLPLSMKSHILNPKFLSNEVSKYPFKPYSEFGKQGVHERQRLYYLLDEDIYKVDYLREISGFWDEEYNLLLTRNKLQDSSNLDISHVNIELSTFKKPLLIELDGNKIECNSFADMVVKVVDYLIIVNHEGITF